jgi:hypothetical protein
LSIVILSVFMLVTVSAASFKDSDMRNTATNIANYAIEYIRSRNATSDNPLGQIGSAGYPGIIDLGSNPVGTTSPTYAAALSINTNPLLPSVTLTADKFYSSLQGYVSLADAPVNGSLSSEDGNAKVVSGKYWDATPYSVTRLLEAPYVVRFPLSATDSGAIKNFTALTGYNGYIYTATAGTGTFASDQHYTTDGTKKAGAMAYRGFRVLTQMVARESSPHVQYYDVQVTVFWILGKAEHSYSVATQITTYGG